MSRYKVEKGIPLPEKGRRYDEEEWDFPFEEMEVGDSFFLPAASIDDIQECRNQASKYKYKLENWSKSFAIRKWENGYRCWRIK